MTNRELKEALSKLSDEQLDQPCTLYDTVYGSHLKVKDVIYADEEDLMPKGFPLISY